MANHHHWPRCQATGKRRLRTHKDVRLALVNASRIRDHAEHVGFETNNHLVRGYRCDACGGWHLTSLPTWELLRSAA